MQVSRAKSLQHEIIVHCKANPGKKVIEAIDVSFLRITGLNRASRRSKICEAARRAHAEKINFATFRFARAAAFIITSVYASKMSAVFMFSTSTVVIYTGIAPRWFGYIGFMLALAVLIGGHHIGWGLAVLPVWVLLISVFILVDIRRRQEANVKTLDNICW